MGPLLITIYASTLFEVTKENLPQAHAYADDTQLYQSFKDDLTFSEIDAISAMECWVDAIRYWMIKEKVCLNQ